MIKFTDLIKEDVDVRDEYKTKRKQLDKLSGKVSAKDKKTFMADYAGEDIGIRAGSGSQNMIKAKESTIIESMVLVLTQILWDQDYHYNELNDKDERKKYRKKVVKFAEKLAKGNWKTILPYLGVSENEIWIKFKFEEDKLRKKYAEGLK